MSDTRKIVTNYDKKPLPMRSYDWIATFDDYEEGHPIGMGRTEQDAIDDLHQDAELKGDE